jgi:uncharacterized protein YggT (Ycf19 family)
MIVYYIFNLLCNILVGLLFVRAILSWVANPYRSNPNSLLPKIYAFLIQVTEPLLKPARRLLSRFNMGAIDFSLFLTMLLIYMIKSVVGRVLLTILNPAILLQ